MNNRSNINIVIGDRQRKKRRYQPSNTSMFQGDSRRYENPLKPIFHLYPLTAQLLQPKDPLKLDKLQKQIDNQVKDFEFGEKLLKMNERLLQLENRGEQRQIEYLPTESKEEEEKEEEEFYTPQKPPPTENMWMS